MKKFLLFLLVPVLGWSQSDSSVIFNYDSFIAIVKEHHPIVFQANIVSETGDAQVLKSKGLFDPKLEGAIQQKYFSGDQYYSLANAGLKVPTWFGLSAIAGYDMNQGKYLNPNDRLPASGLWYAGLELELGNGLIIDQRRAELKKAKIYQEGTELERSIIRNELIMNASITYWEWMNAYYQTKILDEAVLNAKLRLRGVQESVLYGDRPAIDTVEASIQWQSRLFDFNQTKLELQNAKEKLQLFLWKEGIIPLEIVNAIPEKTNLDLIKTQFSFNQTEKDSLLTIHPYLLLNELKVDQNEIDILLKKEQLKPSVTLKYNALSEPIAANPIPDYSYTNYSWGGTISYPIFTRKERGDLKLTKLKMEDLKLNNIQTIAKVNYSIDVSQNKFNNALEQLELYNQTVQYYEKLYLAERQLFNVGESSLFMLNAREKSFLEAQLKQIELTNKTMRIGHELNYQLMVDVFK